MKLSKYCIEKENFWNNAEIKKEEEFIKYINNIIKDDLYQIAKTNDGASVFNKLKVWIFNFYRKQFLEGLDFVGIEHDKFNKRLIYSLLLSIARDKSNTDIILNVLRSANIIKKIVSKDEIYYEIVTKDYGTIKFSKANKIFANDKETIEYINKLGNNIQDGCHEISFYLMEKYNEYKAVTSICKKGLDNNYYHSFVIDNKDNVIDFTANIIMPKEQYYKLQEVYELNCINYEEYLNEKDSSVKYDESNTLYNLLRNAVYKQYLLEQK